MIAATRASIRIDFWWVSAKYPGAHAARLTAYRRLPAASVNPSTQEVMFLMMRGVLSICCMTASRRSETVSST